MDWDDLRYFLALAHTGRLAGAARELGCEHSTVGRRLTALEGALGARLFTRGPRGLSLTRAGREILGSAQRIADSAREIERRVAGLDARAVGAVRVTIPQSVDGYLVRELSRLRALHSELTVELLSDDRPLDLRRGDADVAVRFRDVDDAGLVARKIGTGGWSLYASADYLARCGPLRSLRSLDGHDVVGFDDSLSETVGARWLRPRLGSGRVVLRGNGTAAVAWAAAVGFGLAPLPCFFATRELGLVRLTRELIGSTDILLAVHPDLVKVERVRRVMDFLIELFARDVAIWTGVGGPVHGEC